MALNIYRTSKFEKLLFSSLVLVLPSCTCRITLSDHKNGHFQLFSYFLLETLTMMSFFFRGSKITRMLQESIGSPTCRTTMLAHVSPSLPFYNETLAIAQLASRLHRLRKRKGKVRIIVTPCFLELCSMLRLNYSFFVYDAFSI